MVEVCWTLTVSVDGVNPEVAELRGARMPAPPVTGMAVAFDPHLEAELAVEDVTYCHPTGTYHAYLVEDADPLPGEPAADAMGRVKGYWSALGFVFH